MVCPATGPSLRLQLHNWRIASFLLGLCLEVGTAHRCGVERTNAATNSEKSSLPNRRKGLMLKTLLVVLLSVFALVIAVPAAASAQTAADTQQAEKVKQQVAKLGEGARVSAKLRDRKKLTGEINYVGPDFFMMTDAKTKASQKLAYSDVVQIERKDAHGFPLWGKIVLGVVGVAAVMGMIANGGG